ncbi:MAG: hypothetical protein K8I30_05135, partial [Anaerolineae bacterium]|nr:hypothetical protein [Anaerolineae bacterium]
FGLMLCCVVGHLPSEWRWRDARSGAAAVYPENFRQLLTDLTSADDSRREAARAALLAYDEAIVDPLIGEFYSGVSEVSGVAILDLVAEIGGPDALSLLRNVYHFDDHHAAWREAAALGLLRNRHNLDAAELRELPGGGNS